MCATHLLPNRKKKRIKYFSIKKCILFMVSIHFRWEIPLNFKTSVTNAEIKFTFWLPKQFRLHFCCMCVWACLGKPISYIWFFEKQGHTQTPVLNKEKPAAFDLEQFLRNEAISLNCRSHRNIWNVLSSFLSIKRIAYFLSSIRFLFPPKKKKITLANLWSRNRFSSLSLSLQLI